MSRDALYDSELLRLGLDQIHQDDTFLCSYPKSGNTWLRFLVAHLMAPGGEITFRNIESYVPEIERSAGHLNRARNRPLMKTHWPFVSRYPKFVYIYRDPRDALISYYHYSINNNWFCGTLSEYIRSSVPEFYGAWDTHIQAALEEHAKRPKQICLLKYEELLNSPHEHVVRLASFLGITTHPPTISEAIQKSRFEKLRDMESMYGPETDGASMGFFRKGQACQWKAIMPEQDQNFIWERFGATMQIVGYARLHSNLSSHGLA